MSTGSRIVLKRVSLKDEDAYRHKRVDDSIHAIGDCPRAWWAESELL